MIRELLDMGFETVELSHGLPLSLLPGIQQACREGIVRVSGVHNFCPSPIEVQVDAPDCYEFSSKRSSDRERAMRLTRQSLQTASELGGSYLVLHMGSVAMKMFTPRLEAFMEQGRIYSRDFVKCKLEAVTARQKAAAVAYRRAVETLEELVGDAEKYGVCLAVESRSHYEQVPSEREMRSLQEHFGDNPWVGYWHDFGHVQRQANIGFCDHFQWLESMRSYLVGCHIHDVEWPSRDHVIPLDTNGVDFSGLMPLVERELPLVWELSRRCRKKAVIEGLARWKQRFGG